MGLFKDHGMYYTFLFSKAQQKVILLVLLPIFTPSYKIQIYYMYNF